MTSFDGQSEFSTLRIEPRDELVRSICKQALGVSPVRVEAILGQGIINSVFKLVLEKGEQVILRCVARTAGDTSHAGYDKEMWCLKFLQGLGEFRVPVPLSRGYLPPFEYMLEEYIEGTPGNATEQDHLVIWKKLGACAAVFNRLPVSGYGEKLDTTRAVFLSTWEQVLQDNFDFIFRDDYWTSSGLCGAADLSAMQQRLLVLSELRAPSGLVHIDLGPRNCIVQADGRLALIDWELAEGGMIPYSQLAAVACWWGIESAIYECFCSGYQSVAGSLAHTADIVRSLALMNALHSVRWAQDRHPSSVQENALNAAAMIKDVLGRRSSRA